MRRWCVVLLGMMVSVSAHADDAPHWEFNLSPYLWFGGVHSTFEKVTAPGLPAQKGKTDVAVILPHVTSAPLMLAGEVRYGRFGVGIDITDVSANFGFTSRTPPFLAGNAQVTDVQNSVIGFYRLLQTDQQFLDLGVGERFRSIHSKLRLGRFASETLTYVVDPLIGTRYHIGWPYGLGVTLYGDLGGFNIGSKFTYQVAGTVDYAVVNWLVLRAGYRYSFFDYRGKPVHYSATFNGPVIGVTFRF